MRERRSRTSRALRAAETTAIIVAGLLAPVTLFAFLDTGPQESGVWWAQFLVLAVAFGVPALALRTMMRRRRGRTAPPDAAPVALELK